MKYNLKNIVSKRWQTTKYMAKIGTEAIRGTHGLKADEWSFSITIDLTETEGILPSRSRTSSIKEKIIYWIDLTGKCNKNLRSVWSSPTRYNRLSLPLSADQLNEGFDDLQREWTRRGRRQRTFLEFTIFFFLKPALYFFATSLTASFDEVPRLSEELTGWVILLLDLCGVFWYLFGTLNERKTSPGIGVHLVLDLYLFMVRIWLSQVSLTNHDSMTY